MLFQKFLNPLFTLFIFYLFTYVSPFLTPRSKVLMHEIVPTNDLFTYESASIIILIITFICISHIFMFTSFRFIEKIINICIITGSCLALSYIIYSCIAKLIENRIEVDVWFQEDFSELSIRNSSSSKYSLSTV